MSQNLFLTELSANFQLGIWVEKNRYRENQIKLPFLKDYDIQVYIIIIEKNKLKIRDAILPT